MKLFLCFIISAKAFSQTETFDIVTYTPPKDPIGIGWKKDAKQGVVNYSNANTTTGTFCIIAMYASSASTGNAQKDFNKDWKELVVTPFKAKANPKTETQTTADGWKVVTGAALVKLDGNDLYIILTVVSGFGKTMSIRSSLNDQSYTAQVDALFETMKLDKTKTSPMNKNNTSPAPVNGGATGKFGFMTYNAPAGWSEQIFQDGVVFKPLDLPAEEHLAMQIMQPLNFSGSIEQALQQSYDEAATMYNGTKMHYAGGAEYQKAEAQKSFNGWEYIHGKGGIRVAGDDEFGLELFVIKINNRFERVAILESRRNCGWSRYYASDRRSYRKGIENLLYALKFSDFNAPVLKSGTTQGSGIIGVWQGISMSVGAATKNEPAGVRYKVFSPIFLTNGQAYFGSNFPTEGLDELNSRIPPELHRRDWGTYTFSNGRGVLKMPYANIPLRMENNKLIITPNQTDHGFYKLNSVDGARFNGTYVMSEAYEKIPVITFTADGRFTDNGAIKVLYHEYTDCINPALTPGSGTYEVKNYTVIFKYTDGRKIKIAFLGSGYDIKNQSPASLTMSSNEDLMTRQ